MHIYQHTTQFTIISTALSNLHVRHRKESKQSLSSNKNDPEKHSAFLSPHFNGVLIMNSHFWNYSSAFLNIK